MINKIGEISKNIKLEEFSTECLIILVITKQLLINIKEHLKQIEKNSIKINEFFNVETVAEFLKINFKTTINNLEKLAYCKNGKELHDTLRKIVVDNKQNLSQLPTISPEALTKIPEPFKSALIMMQNFNRMILMQEGVESNQSVYVLRQLIKNDPDLSKYIRDSFADILSDKDLASIIEFQIGFELETQQIKDIFYKNNPKLVEAQIQIRQDLQKPRLIEHLNLFRNALLIAAFGFLMYQLDPIHFFFPNSGSQPRQ